jgi:hypothetical protein
MCFLPNSRYRWSCEAVKQALNVEKTLKGGSRHQSIQARVIVLTTSTGWKVKDASGQQAAMPEASDFPTRDTVAGEHRRQHQIHDV